MSTLIDTLNHDAELPLTAYDCAEYVGMQPHHITTGALETGQRLGQYWMNQLELSDRRKLSGSFEYCPWERDNWLAIQRALQFLLEN